MPLGEKIKDIIAACFFAAIAFGAGMFVVVSIIYGGFDGESIVALIIAVICTLSVCGNIKELVTTAKKTSWKIVQPNSPIVKFESEPVHRTRNKSYYISTVYYADGFEFMSTKTEYSNFRASGLNRQSYTMSVNKEAICQEAQKAHNAAVRKKYRKTGGKL